MVEWEDYFSNCSSTTRCFPMQLKFICWSWSLWLSLDSVWTVGATIILALQFNDLLLFLLLAFEIWVLLMILYSRIFKQTLWTCIMRFFNHAKSFHDFSEVKQFFIVLEGKSTSIMLNKRWNKWPLKIPEQVHSGSMRWLFNNSLWPLKIREQVRSGSMRWLFKYSQKQKKK